MCPSHGGALHAACAAVSSHHCLCVSSHLCMHARRRTRHEGACVMQGGTAVSPAGQPATSQPHTAVLDDVLDAPALHTHASTAADSRLQTQHAHSSHKHARSAVHHVQQAWHGGIERRASACVRGACVQSECTTVHLWGHVKAFLCCT